jgi:hypothetical protein
LGALLPGDFCLSLEDAPNTIVLESSTSFKNSLKSIS